MNSTDVRREWAERSGEYSPDYYAYYGPDEASERVGDVLDRHVGRDASVLELGCSAGRHLAHLLDRGYDDLAGVDINETAAAALAQHYPDLAERATLHVAAIRDALAGVEDDRFDAVFSVETLQHVHPDDAAAFDEAARVAGDLLVTVENERKPHGTVTEVDDGLPLYHRDWHRVFADRGLVEVETGEVGRDTLRVFRPGE